jgi:hypothetical protein
MKKNLDDKINGILGGLRPIGREAGGNVSGLAVRALAAEDLAKVAGGMIIIDDGAGGTETIKQGTSVDCKNDG